MRDCEWEGARLLPLPWRPVESPTLCTRLVLPSCVGGGGEGELGRRLARVRDQLKGGVADRVDADGVLAQGVARMVVRDENLVVSGGGALPRVLRWLLLGLVALLRRGGGGGGESGG